ncbi:MAG: hypothetical protein EOP74_00165 [Variovorax sp.]|nr:MAG: hypothetical protein EOP74_00165 [Variovorax sp.]
MNTEVPQLKIEVLANGCIRLENTDCGESYAVDIHPMHLRYMAEQAGLVRQMSAPEADSLRTAAKCKRRLLVLQKRIDHLASFLCLHSDSQHADLSYEQDYATATADICEEFCADLDEVPEAVEDGHVTQSHGASREVTPVSRVTGDVTKPTATQLEIAA